VKPREEGLANIKPDETRTSIDLFLSGYTLVYVSHGIIYIPVELLGVSFSLSVSDIDE
jgi:cytolysin (calcineurin-like family phosphatase)